MSIQIVIGGAPGLAVRLQSTALFSAIHPVSSTSELRSLVASGVVKVPKNQIAFVFSDTMITDTAGTSLETLIAKLAASGFAVIILATTPKGGQLLRAAPSAGLLEGPFSVNLLLGALAGTGIALLDPVESGFDTVDLTTGQILDSAKGIDSRPPAQAPVPAQVPAQVPVPASGQQLTEPITTAEADADRAQEAVKRTPVAWSTPEQSATSVESKPKIAPPTGTPVIAGRHLPPPAGVPVLPARSPLQPTVLPPAKAGSPLRPLVRSNSAWPTQPQSVGPYTAEHAGAPRRTIVLAVGAAKGGVGKSTLSLSLAVRAGLRLRGSNQSVALIDCNYGQSDIGRYMQIFSGPTIVDIANDNSLLSRENLHKAMVHRPELNLHVLRGPATLTEGNPLWINAGLYNRVVDVMRGMFSVIVLDLPVAEKYIEMYRAFALPQSDFIIVPVNPNVATLLAVDAWLQDICEPEVAGGGGVDPERVGLVLNRSKDGVDCNESDVRELMRRWQLLTVIPESDEWQRANNNGEILAAGTNADLNLALDEILYASTGLSELAPQFVEVESVKRSVFSRFKSKGGR